MSKESWTCWAWADGKGRVRYVGYGSYVNGHPAVVKFAERKQDNSPLHLWLQSHETEPKREICGAALMPKKMAIALASIYRARYPDTLLKSRGPMSYHGGGHPRGVVYCPDDDITRIETYESVRKASKETGVNASSITRRCCAENNHEWHYLISDE